jgi:hypothetical protein
MSIQAVKKGGEQSEKKKDREMYNGCQREWSNARNKELCQKKKKRLELCTCSFGF